VSWGCVLPRTCFVAASTVCDGSAATAPAVLAVCHGKIIGGGEGVGVLLAQHVLLNHQRRLHQLCGVRALA